MEFKINDILVSNCDHFDLGDSESLLVEKGDRFEVISLDPLFLRPLDSEKYHGGEEIIDSPEHFDVEEA